MKKYFLIPLCALFVSLAACDGSDDSSSDDGGMEPEEQNLPRTTIPDINLEQTLVNAGIDDVVDGSVITQRLAEVINLIAENSSISNLSGIEKMPNLETLSLGDNAISEIDLSQNTKVKFIFINNNALTQLSVSNLPLLEKLTFNGNTVSSIDVSSNPSLQQLEFENNKVLNIDVSENGALTVLNAKGNPALCIEVDEDQLDDIPEGWQIDDNDEYSTDCD